MIKNIFVSVVIMAAGTFSSLADIPHMAIGYTGEDLPTTSTLGIGDSGTIKAAALVDPSEIGDLNNLKIMGFNVGIASRINVSELTVWAAESLDSSPLVSVTIDNRPSKGWNEICLVDYIDIPCKPLYIGYTIQTSGASYPVACVDDITSESFWIDCGNGWEEHDGMLGISVEITADNLPSYNLTLVSAEIPSVMHSSKPTIIPIEIRNSGAITINKFSITCYEGNELSQQYDINTKIKPNERLRMDLEVVPLSSESETPIEFTIAITSIEGGEDTNFADNSISGMTRVSRFTFTKRLLVEEFTTMLCSNCPRAAELLHKALEKDEYKDRVFGVCHHSGFFTDRFTQPCDLEMEVLYGSGGTYAPAMCFDRIEQKEGKVVVNVPIDLYDMTSTFDTFLDYEASVDLNITARWDSNIQKIVVDVEGGSANGMPVDNANHITVYVLENEINTPEQAGGGAGYMQQHVIRAYNSTWGEEINWDETGKFKYSVSLGLPHEIVPDNMEVIGLISNYNQESVFDCAIANCARASRIDWSEWAGVDEIASDRSVSVRCYDVFGNQVRSDTKGIQISVRTDANGNYLVKKLLKH